MMRVSEVEGKGVAIAVTPGPGQEEAVAVVPAEDLLQALIEASPSFVMALATLTRSILRKSLE